jgi:hypothetical protein
MDKAMATRPDAVSDASSYVRWPTIIAGAVAGAAVAFVLMAFAAAIGLAVASPSPTWRDASAWLALLSGVWVLLVQVFSFALAGYIAGRMRTKLAGFDANEVEFRDGMHGLLAWAVGVIIGSLLFLAAASASSITRTDANATAARSENAKSQAFLAFELDRLFRSDRAARHDENEASRDEAGRIIMSGLGRRELAAEDQAYLSRLVAARTGLAQPEADRRVNQILEESRRSATQARRSGVIIGFLTAAALVAAAAAAWLAGIAGGRHRDGEQAPLLSWRLSGMRGTPSRPR